MVKEGAYPTSQVYFYDYGRGGSIADGLKSLFDGAGLSKVLKGRVAVKVHIGERGNLTYLRPSLIYHIIKLVKESRLDPFMVETTTLYHKHRFTAEECYLTAKLNGFTEELGAPFIVGDGPQGYSGVKLKVDKAIGGCTLSEIEVASAIAEADSLLLVVHAKGHALSCFGGALKHAAMGCTTKRSKAIQHAACGLTFHAEKCSGCGICIETCPFQALKLSGDKVMRDPSRCMYCNECLFACPNNAWAWPEEGKRIFQIYLAHAAYVVLKRFTSRLAIFSFIQDVTPLCDCTTFVTKPLIPNVGILASLDPVAIDAAALDLIEENAKFSWHEAKPPNFLAKVVGVDPWIHVKVAEELGAGSVNYELIKV